MVQGAPSHGSVYSFRCEDPILSSPEKLGYIFCVCGCVLLVNALPLHTTTIRRWEGVVENVFPPVVPGFAGREGCTCKFFCEMLCLCTTATATTISRDQNHGHTM